jgi:Tfp pilus assembly protein PilV
MPSECLASLVILASSIAALLGANLYKERKENSSRKRKIKLQYNEQLKEQLA